MSTQDLKEFIVTLKNKEDLDDFYDDMETPGGNLYIPDRRIEVANRRAISRNTHYYLTADEAELLKNDSRVLDVSLTPKDLGIVINPLGIINGPFSRQDPAVNSNEKNWGLVRCTSGVADPGGNNAPGSVRLTTTGRHVDVVIVDGHIRVPDHPEYARNADGTGGSRVIFHNWFAPYGGTYRYLTSSSVSDDNHGIHVAGTVAGNTQGWASSSDIYFISPYSTNPNGDLVNSGELVDIIRTFHNNKPINPATGRKNSTVCNNSWGSGTTISAFDVQEVWYRGQRVYRKVNSQDRLPASVMNNVGLMHFGNGETFFVPTRLNWLDADFMDAANDGVILTGSAGNSSHFIDVPGGQDYDNYLTFFGGTRFWHRGGSPGAGPGFICVGALATDEYKTGFSCTGPRVDMYAPGDNIISSIFSSTSPSIVLVNDPRNSNFKLTKYDGTSMASPQVAGVFACILEQYPTKSQQDLFTYIKVIAKYNQIIDSVQAPVYTNLSSLLGAPNRVLYYKKERPDSGTNWPRENHWWRPANGLMWPRPKLRR